MAVLPRPPSGNTVNIGNPAAFGQATAFGQAANFGILAAQGLAVAFGFAVALGLGGCANRSAMRYEKIAKVAERNDYRAAAAAIRKNSKLYGSNDRLLYEMDLGMLSHYGEEYDSSIAHLSRAVRIHEDLFSRSVSNEAAALLTNDNARPYRGKPYEIVLLHQYLAFDYLALGKYDDALVEVRQTQLYLDEIKRKAGKAEKAYLDDGMFRYLSALAYEAAREKDDAAISAYQAVKAYRGGPIPLPASVAAYAAVLLKSAGREEDIRELNLEGDAAAAAPEPGAEIVVVGSAGRGPALDQTVFWGTWVRDGVLVVHFRDARGQEVTEALPAPGLPPREIEKASRGRKSQSGTTVHIKFAMPVLKREHSRTRFFTVAGASLAAPARTEPLTQTEPLLSQYLEENRGSILARTVVRVVIRTMAAQETKSALNTGNPLMNLFLNIFTDVLSDQLEQADLRSSFLLPGSVQVTRIPVKPGVHSLTVQAHDASGQALGTRRFDNVEVKPGQKKFLFFASLQ